MSVRGNFRFLKELKLFFRSTATKNWLNHLLVLHIHKLLTDRLNLMKVADEFVGKEKEKKKKNQNLEFVNVLSFVKSVRKVLGHLDLLLQ